MGISLRIPIFALTMLISIVIFIGNGYAPEIEIYKIYVDIKYNDDSDQDKKINTELATIETFLKRELRALGNVSIVGGMDDWIFRIQLSATDIKNKAGISQDYFAFAYSVQIRVTDSNLINYNYDTPRTIPAVDVEGPIVDICYKDNVSTMCTLLAAIVNKTYIFRE